MGDKIRAKKVAGQHSMDIPHMVAVEMPLIVKNNDRAIEMLGGKQKILQAINADNSNKPLYGLKAEEEKPLELRLRRDRFHHPIQSSTNSREKLVLKVSIPKKNLPEDYKSHPDRYGIRDLLIHNDKQGANYDVKPIGIINKTHSFKSMTDFQVNTKHNEYVQKSNNLVNVQNFDQLQKEFGIKKKSELENPNNGEQNGNRYDEEGFQHEEGNKGTVSKKPETETSLPFLNNKDYRDPLVYTNRPKGLPPPPLFSPIKFPFDYQYEKNSISVTVKDPQSGELKVVSRKADIKLYTQVIDFNRSLEVPSSPAPALLENFRILESAVKNGEFIDRSYNSDLYYCIQWLEKVFEIKPIWLRKHLEDVVPSSYRRVLKQALPYITYIYKNGPWRFCNVKYGLNPVLDRSNWIYQSEYFRISNANLKSQPSSNGNDSKTANRVLPLSIRDRQEDFSDNERLDTESLKVSSDLLFNGEEIPKTLTFQVGDMIDDNIVSLITINQRKNGLLRDQLDYQDGWINKQVIETIRRIVRYKLNQVVKDQDINRDKITKIMNTNYEKADDEEEAEEETLAIDPAIAGSSIVKAEPTENELESKPSQSQDTGDQHSGSVSAQEEEDDLDEPDPEAELEAELDDDDDSESELITSTEQEIMNQIKKYDSGTANKLSNITSILKQESFM